MTCCRSKRSKRSSGSRTTRAPSSMSTTLATRGLVRLLLVSPGRWSSVSISVLLLASSGAAIADIENFNVLNSTRSAELDNVALTRLHQGSRNRRYPTHLLTIEIGLVDANDGDHSLRSPFMSIGDGRAKEHVIQVFLLCRVDHLSDFQPLGKKPYSPVNLAQTAFTVNVIAIF